MNIDIKTVIDKFHIQWQRHALERMMERGISRKDVIDILTSGEIIEDYPNDTPYPSALILGWTNRNPLHVVFAYDATNKVCFIITAYRPDLMHFKPDYKTRK